MKIALYIEDGLEQIVLTPTSTEKAILGKLHDGTRELSIKRGEFYACRGVGSSHRGQYPSVYGSDPKSDESTMIILTPADPAPSAIAGQ